MNTGKMTWAWAAGGLFILANVVMYAFHFGGPVVFDYWTNLMPFIAASSAAAAAFLAWRGYQPGERPRPVWLLLGIGLLCDAIAEAIWACYALALRVEVPYPSWADFLWMLGYIPLILAMLVQFRLVGVRPSGKRVLVLVLAFAVVLILVVWQILWPIATQPGGSLVERSLDFFYPIADLSVALGALLLVSVFGRGRLGRPWLTLAVGLLMWAFADLWFVYLTWHEMYDSYDWRSVVLQDIPYLMAYVLLALGSLQQRAFLERPFA